MSLLNCMDCNTQVSSKANSCPGCGCLIEETLKYNATLESKRNKKLPFSERHKEKTKLTLVQKIFAPPIIFLCCIIGIFLNQRIINENLLVLIVSSSILYLLYRYREQLNLFLKFYYVLCFFLTNFMLIVQIYHNYLS